MWRHLSPPRPDWLERVQKLGLIYPVTPKDDGTTVPYWNESAWYEITMEEVLAWEAATEELYKMCLAAVKHMATSDEFTDERLFLPKGSLALVRESLKRGDPSVYARFDLAIVDGVPKMLEINGDTPTGLVETGIIQWDWVNQVMPDIDQWNSLHERLVNRWKKLKDDGFFPKNEVLFLHSHQDGSGEEEMTTVYMRDTANEAGLTTYGNAIEDLGWHEEDHYFVDFGDKRPSTIFKLYPWEDMLAEEFGEHIMKDEQAGDPVQWIEPVWKLLLSTKAILPVLWELYPDHPNLLPAFFDDPDYLPSWIAKPLQGREGDNIVVHPVDGDEVVQEGSYGDQPMVYQELIDLPTFDGNYLVVGSWVVDGASAGIICRESDGPVTDYYSRVVPHAIGMNSQPDKEQVEQWLNE